MRLHPMTAPGALLTQAELKAAASNAASAHHHAAVLWLFLGYDGPDARGRTRQQLLGLDDEDLEDIHDYIQWLFPLDEASQFNDKAPVVSAAQLGVIGTDAAVQAGLLASFERMLAFYGLALSGQTVRKGSRWAQRGENWAFFPTHNDLRITRILRSLCLLGRRDLAQAFLSCLEQLADECRGLAKDRPLPHWRGAVRAA